MNLNHHMRWVFGLAAVGLLVTAVESAPEPSFLSRAWQFDMDYGKPRLIFVKQPGESAGRYYWYLPYTVTNNTGEDRLFIPNVTVMANTGGMTTAGRKVSPTVFEQIKREQRNPLLQGPVDVIGKLLQGEDNAKDSVAIWPAFEDDVDRYDVFFGGLSGETAIVTNPVTNEQTVLRKAMHLSFATPGTPVELLGQPVEQVAERWVMR